MSLPLHDDSSKQEAKKHNANYMLLLLAVLTIQSDQNLLAPHLSTIASDFDIPPELKDLYVASE